MIILKVLQAFICMRPNDSLIATKNGTLVMFPYKQGLKEPSESCPLYSKIP